MSFVISVVDGNNHYRQELSRLIESSTTLALGKAYATAEEAMELARMPVDMAIVDVKLPGMSGIDLIRYLNEKTRMECIVCSLYDDEESILQALENGASGYIIKHSSSDVILNAIVEVLNGGAMMTPYIARKVISFFRKPRERNRPTNLSGREYMVMQLLSEGLNYGQIGQKLFISRETVKKHMRSIYHKLHVQNKVQAVNRFMRM